MREELETILKENLNTITAEVAQEALDSEDPKAFFEDLLNNGCQSWMVSSLIYYKDTHAFYDTHYNEIEDIRWELEAEGVEIDITDQDLKNYFAWLAFEHVAYKIYYQLEDGKEED